jgi:hypothetical protein
MKRYALLIILAFSIALPAWAGQALLIPAGFVGKYITVSGIQIRYFQMGSHPDVVLIHGQPDTIED